MDYFYRVKKLKESTVRNYSGILRRMLQQAVDEGYSILSEATRAGCWAHARRK